MQSRKDWLLVGTVCVCVYVCVGVGVGVCVCVCVCVGGGGADWLLASVASVFGKASEIFIKPLAHAPENNKSYFFFDVAFKVFFFFLHRVDSSSVWPPADSDGVSVLPGGPARYSEGSLQRF